MKIRITFDIDAETRRAVAFNMDRHKYDGKRLATREEIGGRIMDGADNSLEMCIYDLMQWDQRTISQDATEEE